MGFKNVTIGKKIGIGFGVILFLIMTLIGVYQFALFDSSERYNHLLETEVEMHLHILEAQVAFGECQRYGDYFLENPISAFFKPHSAKWERV